MLSDWQLRENLPDREKQGIAPYCPGGFVAQPLQAEDNPARTFRFDRGVVDGNTRADLYGHVVIEVPQLRTSANQVSYLREGTSELNGDVSLHLPGVAFSSSQARINIDADYALLTDAEFVLPEQDLHGSADTIERQSEQNFRASGMAFTRCAPGSGGWRIKAARLEIDNEEQVARAWHSRIEVQRVPVLYLPYVSFPLNDQPRTGFLIPTFGSGYYQEYYLHLAPNYDSTLAANYVSGEGLFAHNEFRFLTRNHTGVTALGLELSSGADDATGADNLQTSSERRYDLNHKQSGQFSDWLGYDLQTRWVSHRAYDLEVTPGASELIDYNRLSLDLNTDLWQMPAQLGWDYSTPVPDSSKQFDRLDTGFSVRRQPFSLTVLQENRWATEGQTPEPAQYEQVRQPQITLNATPGAIWQGISLQHSAQYSLFQRDLSDAQISTLSADARTLATATQRTDTSARLSRPLQLPIGTLTPTVEGLYAYYWRDNPTDLNIIDEYGRQSVQQASWRSSLDLSAELPWAGELATHRLKPRLFYAYSPLIEQTGPVLDADTENSFSLFSRARFTSVDRVGDLSRLSAQLAYEVSPLKSATPALSVSARKGVKLSQERLQLDGIDPSDPNWRPEYSPWFLSTRLKATDSLTLEANGDLVHDQPVFNTFALSADYRPSERVFANASWQKTDDSHTISAGAYFPVLQNLALIGYGELSTDNGDPVWSDYQPTQLLVGMDIDNCCWNIRFALLETAAATDEDGTSIFLEQSTIAPYFEVTLKGIGAGTGTIENILNRLDFGYAGRLFNYK